MKEKIKNIIEKTILSSKTHALEVLIVLLCLVLLLTTVTYSWIKRVWTPGVKQNDLQIIAGESLVFSLIGTGNQMQGVTDAIYLNSVLDLENFLLMPVSNFSGNSYDFFKLNTDIYNREYFSHIMQPEVITPEGWSLQGLNNGYIQVQFSVNARDPEGSSGNYTKFVYLSDETYIRVSPSVEDDPKLKEAQKAMRISLTIGEGKSNEITYIFMPSSGAIHNAINNISSGGVEWFADGIEYRAGLNEITDLIDSNGIMRKTQFERNGVTYDLIKTNTGDGVNTIVTTFDAYNGGFGDEDNGAFQQDQALFSMSPGTSETITIRIWLEGEDEACTGAIKGSKIDLMIGFESYNKSNAVSETTTEETTTPPETTRRPRP